MQADDLQSARQIDRFADAEQHPADDERRQAGHQASRGGRERPQGEQHRVRVFDVVPVDETPDRDLHRGVGPEKRRQGESLFLRTQAEVLADHRQRDREAAAVQIVDEGGRAEQRDECPPG